MGMGACSGLAGKLAGSKMIEYHCRCRDCPLSSSLVEQEAG